MQILSNVKSHPYHRLSTVSIHYRTGTRILHGHRTNDQTSANITPTRRGWYTHTHTHTHRRYRSNTTFHRVSFEVCIHIFDNVTLRSVIKIEVFFLSLDKFVLEGVAVACRFHIYNLFCRHRSSDSHECSSSPSFVFDPAIRLEEAFSS